jgi:3',5'-cyclic AMP phosphodiesterase CpdA
VARSLFGSFGLLDPAKLTVIPGNHDIYGGVHTAEDILDFPTRCRTTVVKDREREFVETFRETFRGCVHPEKEKAFPFAKLLGDVALFGLNSVAPYSAVKNPVGSNGRVGDRQRDLLQDLLGSPVFEKKRKVVLIHHHFEKRAQEVGRGALQSIWTAIERHTMKLRGRKDLLRLFEREHVDLVLHGHVHASHRYRVRRVNFLNAGGSVAGLAEGSVNLLTVRRGRLGVEIREVEAPILEARGDERIGAGPHPEHAAA